MPSSLARAAINAQNTGEVFLQLLTMSHPAFGGTVYRFVNDMQDVTSNGHSYISWPFELSFPELGGDTLPTLTLTIDNIDQSIWNTLKDIVSPVDVTLSWVLRSAPDTVEGGPLFMRLRSTEVDVSTIIGSLNFEDLMNEPFPRESYTPTSAPGLF